MSALWDFATSVLCRKLDRNCCGRVVDKTCIPDRAGREPVPHRGWPLMAWIEFVSRIRRAWRRLVEGGADERREGSGVGIVVAGEFVVAAVKGLMMRGQRDPRFGREESIVLPLDVLVLKLNRAVCVWTFPAVDSWPAATDIDMPVRSRP